MSITVTPEILLNLRKIIPFKWRVQRHFEWKGPEGSTDYVIMSAYVDARDVAEHLDSIIGPNNWRDRYYEVCGNVYCGVSIRVGDDWIERSDVGSLSNVDPEKGQASDAFKRACVKWGVNRAAYRATNVKLRAKQSGKSWYPIGDDGKYLKGQPLWDKCNAMAKIEEMDDFNPSYAAGSDAVEAVEVEEVTTLKPDPNGPSPEGEYHIDRPDAAQNSVTSQSPEPAAAGSQGEIF